MKKFQYFKSILCLFVMMTYAGMVFSYSLEAKTEKSIFYWVKSKMEVDEDIRFPEVRFVNRQQLQQAFESNAQRSYKRWIEKHGKQKAKEIFENYRNGLLGLFDPNTKLIYIADFIESCDTKAILAHEMTHYIQEVGDSVTIIDSPDEGQKQYFRELYAYNIEENYRNEFCVSNHN